MLTQLGVINMVVILQVLLTHPDSAEKLRKRTLTCCKGSFDPGNNNVDSCDHHKCQAKTDATDQSSLLIFMLCSSGT